jgi:hypothetical protein
METVLDGRVDGYPGEMRMMITARRSSHKPEARIPKENPPATQPTARKPLLQCSSYH